jgi:hypothetical protein
VMDHRTEGQRTRRDRGGLDPESVGDQTPGLRRVETGPLISLEWNDRSLWSGYLRRLP